MNKRVYEQWEDIYPLTLINLRYSGYVAFNAEEDAGFIQKVNAKEVSYQLEAWLKENVDPCLYGVGETIKEAMNNLLYKMNMNECVNKKQIRFFYNPNRYQWMNENGRYLDEFEEIVMFRETEEGQMLWPFYDKHEYRTDIRFKIIENE